MTPNEIFKANFHNPKLRKDFKDLSGLDAESNPAAYIAFINSLWASLNDTEDRPESQKTKRTHII
jgi:hypothetical protein